MRFVIGGVPVRMHVLLPLLWALAVRMGLGQEALALLAALLGHEAAHVLAAKAAGMRVKELELTPMGAAARLDNPWNAGAARMVGVSLAGPAANLLLLGLWAAVSYAGWINPRTAWRMIRANWMLMTVNLVPALPLDGGRALCALLADKMGAGRAARLGIRAGCAFAACLALAALWLGATRGVWNLSLFSAAAYLCACALHERDAAAGASAEGLVFRREELQKKGALPVRELAVCQELPLAQAMRLVRPGCVQIFRLYDAAMCPVGVLEESALLEAFPTRAEKTLAEIAKDARRHSEHG